jgi:acetylornithine deacetylase/succinyl-diaminopimelate desuccinylase-like protein
MEIRRGRRPTLVQTVAELAAERTVARALAWPEQHATALVDETVRMAEIPAPTFGEATRAAYTAERFQAVGLERVEIDATGNVYGLLPGDGERAVALVAHLDTVFSADIPHAVIRRDTRLYGPGIGDNAAGLAGLVGAAAALRAGHVALRRPIWFVATVGEEGLGNLRGSLAATERLGAQIEAMIAVEGSFFGRLSYSGVGSRRLEIRCQSAGGHSWHDFGRPSAVHVLVRAAADIAALQVPAQPRTTFNIGRIEGGTGVNVIAEEARLLLDLRSVEASALDELTARVYAVVRRHEFNGVRITVREVGYRPAGSLDASHRLVQTCSAVLQRLGVHPQCAPASTDANIPLSRGIPAVTLGVTRGGGAHTRGEWIDASPLARGIQQLILAALALGDPRTADLTAS